MTEWHPLDSYYLWPQEPESIKKHCIYSESHLIHLAAGLIVTALLDTGMTAIRITLEEGSGTRYKITIHTDSLTAVK